MFGQIKIESYHTIHAKDSGFLDKMAESDRYVNIIVATCHNAIVAKVQNCVPQKRTKIGPRR